MKIKPLFAGIILLGLLYGATALMSGQLYGWSGGFCWFFGFFGLIIVLKTADNYI